MVLVGNDERITALTNPQLFIVKSIDRFTRGGFKPYGDLKEQLEKLDIGLIDTFGVIGTQKINTLEYLGLEYDWSVYSPTLKSELLAAEQSRDEITGYHESHDRSTDSLLSHGLLGAWRYIRHEVQENYHFKR